MRLDQVSVEVGDSDLPPAPGAGGSNSTASLCNVVAKACEDLRGRLAAAAVAAGDGALRGADAVYHATGVRIRELPIRAEKLLTAPALQI